MPIPGREPETEANYQEAIKKLREWKRRRSMLKKLRELQDELKFEFGLDQVERDFDQVQDMLEENSDIKFLSEALILLSSFCDPGLKPLVKYCLDKGVHPNYWSKFTVGPKYGAVHIVIDQGKNFDILDLFFSKGDNLEAKSEAGMTPLHIAILRGKPEFVKYLLQKGADLGAKPYETKDTALEILNAFSTIYPEYKEILENL